MAHQAIYRPRPPLVRQRQNLGCWAAALESWLRVCCPGVEWDQAWALQTFAQYQGPDHRLDWEALKKLADALGMAGEEVGAGGLTGEYLSRRLHQGHLYLSYMPVPGPVSGHTVVAYGIGPVSVDLMDPNEGYTSKPLEFFETRSRAFVAWPQRLGRTPLFFTRPRLGGRV